MDERTFLVAMIERLTDLLDHIEDRKKESPIEQVSADCYLPELECSAKKYLIALLTFDHSVLQS